MADADDELVDIAVRLPRRLVETVFLNLAPARDGPARRLGLAKWVLLNRRRRSKLFGSIRFGEPTWDMILDLYIATLEGRRIDVTSLCLASGVAPTTAQRYVDILVVKKLVHKVGDERDGRRAFVEMHDALRTAVDDWLEQADAGLVMIGFAEVQEPA